MLLSQFLRVFLPTLPYMTLVLNPGERICGNVNAVSSEHMPFFLIFYLDIVIV